MATTSALFAPSCASCVFGAVETSLLSFTYHDVKTITVEYIPYITYYPDGHSSVSYSTTTLTGTDIIGSGASGQPATTYTNPNDITWTYQDATLTYPTTYVQYLTFKGAPVTSDDGQTCAQQSDATEVVLPASTAAASFIYALPVNATTVDAAIPTSLLAYLDDLPGVSSQFHGDALTGCAPLNYAPLTARHEPLHRRQATPMPFQKESKQTPTPRRYEGARRETPQHPLVTAPAHLLPANGTLYKRQGTGTGTGTVPYNQSPSYFSTETPTYAPPSSVGTNTHSTAFVIQPITGRPIVTSISALPDNNPTTSPHDHPGTSPTHHVTSGSGGNPGNMSPDLGNLISQIGHVATSTPGGSGGNGGSGDTGPDLSNLMSQIGHVATSAGGDGGGSPPTEGSSAGSMYSGGNTVVSADSDGAVVYGSQTVAPGHSITVGSGGSATIVALQTNGGSTELVVGGSTYNHAPDSAGAAGATTSEVVVTAGGHTFTAIDASGSVVVVDATSTASVKDGSVITFEGQTVSAEPSGTAVVVDGTTYKMTAASTGLSGYISSGLSGGGPTSTAGVSPASALPTTNAASSGGIPFGTCLTFVIPGMLSAFSML